MVFKIATPKYTITDSSGTTGNYLPINFKGLYDFLDGEDSVLKQIDDELGEDSEVKNITLNLKDIQNEVTGPIYLAIGEKNHISTTWRDVISIADGVTPAPVDLGNINLSALDIKFLVPEESAGPPSTGLLYIQRQEAAEDIAFSIKISVIADIALDKEIDF
jgi:hypothetical protein